MSYCENAALVPLRSKHPNKRRPLDIQCNTNAMLSARVLLHVYRSRKGYIFVLGQASILYFAYIGIIYIPFKLTCQIFESSRTPGNCLKSKKIIMVSFVETV
jgi:hypothetical protein